MRGCFAGPLVAIALLDSVAACKDPVHDSEVSALGSEAAGVSPGPTHRPGQPCLTCHGGDGPAGATFVTAGTVYSTPYAAGTTTYPALIDGEVFLVDAKGSTYTTTTNAVGNFYVRTGQWNPTFPLGDYLSDAGKEDITVLAASGSDAGTAETPMSTAIHRGGVYASCGYCHFDPPGPTSPGHVYSQ